MVIFDVGIFFFEAGGETIFLAFALMAVGGLVGIRTCWVVESEAGRVGPEFIGNGGEIFGGDGFWIITVLLVKILFEGIIDRIDGGFASIVAGESVEVGFLDG